MPHKLSLCNPVYSLGKKHHKLSLYGPVCQQPTALGGAKKHHKLSLCSPVCQQPTALGGPQKASQVVLCIPVCRQPTALGGPQNSSKLSLCSLVCRQPTALGGPQNPSQVVQPAMPWVVPLEMPSLALPLGMPPWSSQPQGSRKGDVNQKQQVCKRVDSERFQMSNVAPFSK